ncbi:hypothetical protein ACVBEJ_05010 [Porticoccus sp. GXU_MW_L64]
MVAFKANASGLSVVLTCLWSSSATITGLSLGLYLDMGVFDVQFLYWVCGSGGMFALAPFAALGMTLGCNFGMLMSAGCLSWTRILYCNIGMLLGMWVFEWLHNYFAMGSGLFVLAGHVASMVFFAGVIEQVANCIVRGPASYYAEPKKL